MILAQVTASGGIPQKKQHIMISYNRSCEENCRKIRNKLKVDINIIFVQSIISFL